MNARQVYGAIFAVFLGIIGAALLLHGLLS